MLFELTTVYLLFGLLALVTWALILNTVTAFKRLDEFEQLVSYLVFGIFWPFGLGLLVVAVAKKEWLK